MTGGRGTRTIFGRHKIILPFHSGVKNKKKFFIPHRTAGLGAGCFWGTIFAGGHDLCLGGHNGIERCGSRFMPQIQGGKKTQQRRLSSRNLKLRHSVHPCFRPRTKVYLRLGGGETSSVFGGASGPEKHFSGTRLVHIFCLEGTSSD